MSNRLGGRAAIVGIGATEFSKDSGRSEMSLACEAAHVAIRDAGLAPADIDGMVTYSADNNPDIEIARNFKPMSDAERDKLLARVKPVAGDGRHGFVAL